MEAKKLELPFLAFLFLFFCASVPIAVTHQRKSLFDTCFGVFGSMLPRADFFSVFNSKKYKARHHLGFRFCRKILAVKLTSGGLGRKPGMKMSLFSDKTEKIKNQTKNIQKTARFPHFPAFTLNLHGPRSRRLLCQLGLLFRLETNHLELTPLI